VNKPEPRLRPQTSSKAKAPGFDRGPFYRLCRMLHAYLSAFAFLTLIFFAITGLLLDHPEWLQGKSHETEIKLQIPAAELAAAQRAPDPSKALAATVGKMTRLVGAYRSGEVQDGQDDLRFEGVKGASTVLIDLKTGQADVTVERATALSVIGDLHRGKNATLAWRMVIDASAIVILALSVIGYVLFFSLRLRLRTSLILTALSLLAMVGVYVWFTA
jgi:hypothetical protein